MRAVETAIREMLVSATIDRQRAHDASQAAAADDVYRAPDFRGSLTQQTAITSEPAGAIVRLNGVVVGATPPRPAGD
jgi:hypothetical protein